MHLHVLESPSSFVYEMSTLYLGAVKKYTVKEGASDADCMLAIQSGNRDALTPLYSRYAGKLYGYFFRMLGGDKAQAEDFTQDVFGKIIEKPGLYDPQRSFSTWLFTLAANLCKNEYRKRAHRNKIHTSADASHVPGLRAEDLARDIDMNTFMEALNLALSEMDEIKRSTFLLRFQQELSIKEIAEITESEEGTVKSRLFYITKHLSQQLKHLNPKLHLK
jgi:RNA polymerase sigma-70 factor (ECF subfamily)